MQTLPIDTVQDRLAGVWFIGAGISCAILVIQSLLGKYHESVHDIWGWFVTTVAPTLGLILGVIGARALIPAAGQTGSEQPVNHSFLSVAFWLSLSYLALLLITILFEPFSPEPFKGLKLYNLANYWLGPIQGLVVAAVTVLFNSKHQVPARRQQKPIDPKPLDVS
jgi:hypothetical protein